MLREVSIVLSSETTNYRQVAQRHWGLTDEQMKGMHVHHFPPKSRGGRNVPEHLYVCSESMHHHGWHNASIGYTLWASSAAKTLHSSWKERDPVGYSDSQRERSKNLHSNSDHQRKAALKAAESHRRHKTGFHNPEIQKLGAVAAGKKLKEVHKQKDENGISVYFQKTLGKYAKEHPEQRQNARQRAAQVTSKQVEVTKLSTGEVYVYNSLSQACRCHSLSAGVLSEVARGKRESTKGFSARYI